MNGSRFGVEGHRGNELFCTSRANSSRPTFRKTSPRVACDAHAQFTCTGGGLMSVEDTRGGPLHIEWVASRRKSPSVNLSLEKVDDSSRLIN